MCGRVYQEEGGVQGGGAGRVYQEEGGVLCAEASFLLLGRPGGPLSLLLLREESYTSAQRAQAPPLEYLCAEALS